MESTTSVNDSAKAIDPDALGFVSAFNWNDDARTILRASV
jgi:hypothetical protein